LSETLDQFNDLPADEAERRLLACCGSRAWASTVAARRPYADRAALMEVADSVWTGLTPPDWLEAFAAHPRLGERGGRSPDVSQKEQSRMMRAEDETLAALAEENRLYEARFGHIFLMSAAGHTAEDILAALRRRIGNDGATEVKVAAEEQRKITRLRLERMLQA
jgi:OHCU decarboxylase